MEKKISSNNDLSIDQIISKALVITQERMSKLNDGTKLDAQDRYQDVTGKDFVLPEDVRLSIQSGQEKMQELFKTYLQMINDELKENNTLGIGLKAKLDRINDIFRQYIGRLDILKNRQDVVIGQAIEKWEKNKEDSIRQKIAKLAKP